MTKILALYTRLSSALDKAQPLLMLFARLWIAHIFWQSGMVKLHDWSGTLYLFSNEYSVPLLSPGLAAVMAAVFELSCPVLLTLGLLTRLAAIPLIVMTAVINFTYQNLDEHYYWAMLLGFILFYGPGSISLDFLEMKRAQNRRALAARII